MTTCFFKKNQKIFINFIESAQDYFITSIFEDINGILQLFKINRDNPEFPAFKDLFNEFHLCLNDSESFETQNFISKVNKIVIELKSKIYEPLLMALISIFSILKIEWKKHYRQILLFLFKSLSLEWPLFDKDFNIFNTLLIEFKQNTGLNSFFKSIPILTDKEINSTITLTKEILKSELSEIKKPEIKEELFKHEEEASYESDLNVDDLVGEEASYESDLNVDDPKEEDKKEGGKNLDGSVSEFENEPPTLDERTKAIS